MSTLGATETCWELFGDCADTEGIFSAAEVYSTEWIVGGAIRNDLHRLLWLVISFLCVCVCVFNATLGRLYRAIAETGAPSILRAVTPITGALAPPE